MRHCKRLISFLLVAVMILGLLPAISAAEPVDLTTDQYTIDFDFNIVQDNQGLCFNMKDTGTFIMWQVSTYEGADSGAGDIVLLRPHFKSGGAWKGYPGQNGYNVEAVNLTEKLGLTGSQLEARTEPVHERIVVSGNNIKTYFGLNGETANTPTEDLILAYDFTYSGAETLPYYGLGFRMSNDGEGHSQEITQIDNIIAKCNTTGDILYQNDFSDGKPGFSAGNGVSFVTEDGWLQVGNPEKVSEQIYTQVADIVTLEIPEGKEAWYEADVYFDGVQAVTMSLGEKEVFSVSPANFRVENRTVAGEYGAGTYHVKMQINPTQNNLIVDVTKPDGGTVCRGGYDRFGSDILYVYSSNYQALSNTSLTYTDISPMPYELTQTEPVYTGFQTKVYNLSSSFEDPCTSRNFCWAANAQWLGSDAMAVKYRKAGESEWIVVDAVKDVESDASQDFFECDIYGLTAGTTYEYTYGKKDSADAADWSEVNTFTTAAEDIDSFTFFAIADTQGITWNGTTDANKGYNLAEAAYKSAFADVDDPAFILHAGDVSEYGANVNHWNMFYKAFGAQGSNTPHFSTMGGHDSWVMRDGSNNTFYFQHQFNHPDNGRKELLDQEWLAKASTADEKRLVERLKETIWSFTYDNLHVISLNTGDSYEPEEILFEAQRQWLIDDLEANKDAQWTIIICHESFYDPTVSKDEFNPLLRDVVEGYGVDLVLSGHRHIPTRTYPMRNSEIVTKNVGDVIEQGTGTIYTILGSTALNHHGAEVTEHQEELQVHVSPDPLMSSYTVFTVTDDALTFTGKQANGLVYDQFTIVASEKGNNVSKSALYNALGEAEAIMGSILVNDGDASNVAQHEKYVTSAEMATMEAALAAAEAAFYNAYTDEAVAQAEADLAAALEAFQAAAKSGVAAELTIQVASDAPVEATVSVNGVVKATALPAVVTAMPGDTVELSGKLLNDAAHTFEGWLLDGESISEGETASFTVVGNATVTMNAVSRGLINLAQGANTSSSHSVANSSWALAQLVDGNLDKGWSTSSLSGLRPSAPRTATIDLRGVHSFDRIHIYPRVVDGKGLLCYPDDFTVSVSTDNSTWKEIASYSTSPFTTEGPLVIQLEEAVTARYVKISVAAVGNRDSGDTGTPYVQLMEVGIYRTQPVELEPVELNFADEATQGRVDTLNNTVVTNEADCVTLTVGPESKSDPRVNINMSGDPRILAQDYPYLVVTYKTAVANRRSQMFVMAGHHNGALEAGSVSYDLISDGQWHSAILDLNGLPTWYGKPNTLRFDYFMASEIGDSLSLKSVTYCQTLEQAKAVAGVEDEPEVDPAVAAVIAAIDAIPPYDTLTVAHESVIASVRDAYDALSDAQKALVENYAVLTAAEARIAELVAEAEKAVNDVIALIDAINVEDKATIEAARAAYDALTEAQKEKVTNYAALTEAEHRWNVVNGVVALALTGADEVNGREDEVVYTLSAKGMTDLATVLVSVEVPEACLTDVVAKAAEGWEIVVQSRKGDALHVLAVNIDGANGDGDILTITADPAEVNAEVTVKVTEVELVAYLGEGETYVQADLTAAAVTTAVKAVSFDVNRDGVIDQRDMTRAQRYFGSTPDSENWNPDADVNGDKTVDVADLVLILNNFSDAFV